MRTWLRERGSVTPLVAAVIVGLGLFSAFALSAINIAATYIQTTHVADEAAMAAAARALMQEDPCLSVAVPPPAILVGCWDDTKSVRISVKQLPQGWLHFVPVQATARVGYGLEEAS